VGPEIIRLRKLAHERGSGCRTCRGVRRHGLGRARHRDSLGECRPRALSAFIINCQAPDEGNRHTLLHFASPMQRQKF